MIDVIESFENVIKELGWIAIKSTSHDELLVMSYMGHKGLEAPISRSPHIKVLRSRE